MVEVIITVHTPEGPQSVSHRAKDEAAARDFLRGAGLNGLGEKAARALTPDESKSQGKADK